MPERSLDFARDDVAEAAFSQHILYTGRGLSILPYRHFERSEKSSLHSALSCSFRRSIPLFRYHTYGAIPVCQKDPSTSLGMTLRKWRFPNIPFIRDVGYPSPRYRHFERSRKIFLALCSFLLPSQKDSPSLLSHIQRYTGVQERSLDFARDDVTGIVLSKHIRCTLREINTFPRYRHFERSEKSSLHFALSCSFHGRIPLPCCRTYGAIPVCQKDPSASLGMTLREYRSLTLPIYFPCNNDTREAPSTFAALLFFMRRTTPLNPTT